LAYAPLDYEQRIIAIHREQLLMRECFENTQHITQVMRDELTKVVCNSQ